MFTYESPRLALSLQLSLQAERPKSNPSREPTEASNPNADTDSSASREQNVQQEAYQKAVEWAAALPHKQVRPLNVPVDGGVAYALAGALRVIDFFEAGGCLPGLQIMDCYLVEGAAQLLEERERAYQAQRTTSASYQAELRESIRLRNRMWRALNALLSFGRLQAHQIPSLSKGTGYLALIRDLLALRKLRHTCSPDLLRPFAEEMKRAEELYLALMARPEQPRRPRPGTQDRIARDRAFTVLWLAYLHLQVASRETLRPKLPSMYSIRKRPDAG